MKLLEVENLSLKFDTGRSEESVVQAIRDLSFSIEAGEFVALIGPSGSGKSSLFRVIAGLASPTAGKVHLGTKPAYLLQNHPLIMRASALTNMLVGTIARMRIWRRLFWQFLPEDRKRAMALSQNLALDSMVDRLTKNLSGGQQQRVAVGRVLMQDSKLVLFDEPTSAQDPKLREQVINVIKSEAVKNKSAVICSFHNLSVLGHFDRVIALKDGKKFFDGPRKQFTVEVARELYASEVGL